jgi:uncharacterized protein (DUF2236 family)
MNLPRPPLSLARPIQHRLEGGLAHLLWPDGKANEDFLHPHGELALIDSDSTSWKVFKNPLALFIGGVTAVVLELAEPRVRAGVWQYTSFRERPLDRLRRTGYAAMMSVYGPRSRAESMIAGVARMHSLGRGVASDGRAFRASDPELLDWVHATASFGFLEAYHAYVRPLSALQRDRFYVEGKSVARLYGAVSAPGSQAALEALFDSMSRQLERSDVLFEFLRIMRRVPALPAPLRPLQGVLIKAAVQVIPAWLRDRIGLGEDWNLAPWQLSVVRRAGDATDRLILGTNPAVQGCRRLGLPDDYLYSHG